MKPIEFPGCNVVFGKNQPEYMPLPAERIENNDFGQVVTCWELSEEEREKVLQDGKIWVSLLTFGHPLQPILVTAEKPGVYQETENK